MKRPILVLLLLVLVLGTASAGVFSSYDFTFYNTVENSMRSFSRQSVGLDVTGYGFLGQMTDGVYLRIGLQTPFDTILTLLYRALTETRTTMEEDDFFTRNDEEGPLQEELNHMEDTLTSLIQMESPAKMETSQDEDDIPMENTIDTRWSGQFTIGPAYRSMMGDNAMVYLGTGFSSLLSYHNTLEETGDSRRTLSLVFGGDIDAGFRIAVKAHTTIRIGVHFTADVLGYESFNTYSKDNELLDSLSYAYGYLLSPDSYNGVGYVRLATTFRNSTRKVVNYSNTTPYLGKGTTTVIEY